MMRWLVFLMLFFGTSVSAQSIDQRKLTECITEANELIDFANAWIETAKSRGDEVELYELAFMLRNAPFEDVLMNTKSMLEADGTKDEISKAIDEATKPIYVRMERVFEMIEEAIEDPNSYDKMAEYVTQCAANYGGEVYTLQDEIRRLEMDFGRALLKISEMESDHFAEVEALETQIEEAKVAVKSRLFLENKSLLERMDFMISTREVAASIAKARLDFLCRALNDLEQFSVTDKQVYVQQQWHDVCD